MPAQESQNATTIATQLAKPKATITVLLLSSATVHFMIRPAANA